MTVPSPGLVRFEIPVWPKDGGPHHTLHADLDVTAIPQEGDTVGLDTEYGVTTWVKDVAFYPTCDPAVYANCKPLYPLTTAEADEIVDAAVNKYGWKVL